MDTNEPKMLSIWFWVGSMLGIYGLIVFSCGIYYHFVPNAVSILSHNPGLWWGAIMLLASVVFLFIAKKAKT